MCAKAPCPGIDRSSDPVRHHDLEHEIMIPPTLHV